MNKDDYQKEYTTSQREVVPGNQKTSTWIEKEKKRRKDAAKKKFTDAQLAEVGGLDYDHAMKTPSQSQDKIEDIVKNTEKKTIEEKTLKHKLRAANRAGGARIRGHRRHANSVFVDPRFRGPPRNQARSRALLKNRC